MLDFFLKTNNKDIWQQLYKVVIHIHTYSTCIVKTTQINGNKNCSFEMMRHEAMNKT